MYRLNVERNPHMNTFKEILKGFKFAKVNGLDIDFDKVRTLSIVKDDLKGGDRLTTTAQYDNGQRFEVIGEHQLHDKAAKPATPAPAAKPVKVVGSEPLIPGEAVVSTASPTASAPGAIQRTDPAVLTKPQAARMTGPVTSAAAKTKK
jgi:hypothetical protein